MAKIGEPLREFEEPWDDPAAEPAPAPAEPVPVPEREPIPA